MLQITMLGTDVIYCMKVLILAVFMWIPTLFRMYFALQNICDSIKLRMLKHITPRHIVYRMSWTRPNLRDSLEEFTVDKFSYKIRVLPKNLFNEGAKSLFQTCVGLKTCCSLYLSINYLCIWLHTIFEISLYRHLVKF